MARIATTYMWVEESEDGTGVRVENPVDGGIVRMSRDDDLDESAVIDDGEQHAPTDMPVQAARELIAALARFDRNVLTGDEEG